ncbi:hypothetical protein [Streptomyces sp. NBC_00984]|uniref:hypothetical protein n=1 Tax=Streptomyces sp. NBC_00984 TaxID=2903700 RepID=UPI00386A8A1E
MSEREHVDVQVIPVDRGAFPGAGRALLYAHGVVPQLGTAQLDSAHGPEFMHADAQLTNRSSVACTSGSRSVRTAETIFAKAKALAMVCPEHNTHDQENSAAEDRTDPRISALRDDQAKHP